MADINLADQLKQLQQMADNKGNILCMDGDKPVALPLATLFSQIVELAKQNAGVSADALGKADSLNMLGQVKSFAELRTLKPAGDGIRVSLKGWNEGKRYGGGEFIGHLNAKAADDGGTVASSGQNWYWTRVAENPDRLDVTHFGAVPDKTIGCAPAVAAMFKWSQDNYPRVGIRFPAGEFFLSQFKVDGSIPRFRVSGQQSNFGYFSGTSLVSNTDNNFMFDVKARWTEIAGLNFNGGNKTVKNTKGFFNNREIEGQYIRLHCLYWEYVGGTCVQMVDCLDTHIDQWYASHCTGDVIAATWSNSPKGKWDHVTAIELTNFNAQFCTVGKVLNLPRATQSILTNGWIEHSDNPGDITNGHWTVTGFSVEDCKTPLRANFTRFINVQENNQSGSSWDISDNPADGTKRWLNGYERGNLSIQHHGIQLNGTMDTLAFASHNKLNNASGNAQWFCLGRFFTPLEGDSIDINLIGTGDNLTVGTKLDKLDDVRQGGGNTLIRAHATKAGIQLSHQPVGSSPALAVKYVSDKNNVTIYVKLKKYTYNVIPLVTFNGQTRFEAGVSVFWWPDLTPLDEGDIIGVPGTDKVAIPGIMDSVENWSMGQKAGVGGSDDGYLLLKSKTVGSNLQVKVEGNIYNIALTKADIKA